MRKDVDADFTNHTGRSLLSLAADQGNEEVVRLILERDDVNVNRRDGSGRTALSWAAERGREEIVKLLLECDGIEAYMADDTGCTPLIWATGHMEVMRLLEGPTQEYLCSTCRDIDFHDLSMPFRKPLQLHFHQSFGLFWSIPHLKQESRGVFCRFLFRILQMAPGFDIEQFGTPIAKGEPSFPTAKETSKAISLCACSCLPYNPGGSMLTRQPCEHARARPPYDMTPTYTPIPYRIHLKGKERNHKNYFDQVCPVRILRKEVDVTLLKSWLFRCEGHRSCSSSHTSSHSKSNLRIIDVQNASITQARSDGKYVALSYRWGGTKQLMLSKGNYQQLARDGAVSSTTKGIPKTIRDAMQLCDVLDDDEDKAAQIENMGSVYANAFFTIVAAAGRDAEAGLPGVCTDLITTQRSITNAVDDSEWNRRAWTFQESLLSHRLLVFTKKSICFRCHSIFCSEELVLEHGDELCWVSRESSIWRAYTSDPGAWAFEDLGPRPPESSSIDWEMRRYRKLVNFYIQRRLTKEEDRLRAFAGIMKLLEPELGSFWHGMPQATFASALMWPTFVDIRRNPDLDCPSWFWAGWLHEGRNVYVSEDHPLHGESLPETLWGRLLPGKENKHVPQDHLYRQSSSAAFYRLSNSQQLSCFATGRNEIYWAEISRQLVPGDIDSIEVSSLAVQAPTSNLLVFWTSCAKLAVWPMPFIGLEDLFSITSVDGERISVICLDFGWRLQQSAKLEFILISFTVNSLYVMAIDWTDGVAYRKGVASIDNKTYATENPEKNVTDIRKFWTSANPTRKLVVLG